jgi:two-component system LytT family sensor kinase
VSVQLSLKRPGALVWPSGRLVAASELFWLLQSGGWGAFGLLMLGRALVTGPFLLSFIEVVTLVASGIALTVVYRQVYRHCRARGIVATRSAPLVLVLAVAGAALWNAGARILARAAESALHLVGSPGEDAMGLHFESWLLYAFVLLTWSLLYFGVNGWISLALARRRAARAESAAQVAQLQALQAQLQPHFLFNTLNAISTLVIEGHTSAAAEMIARLGDFLRLSLHTAAMPEVTVAQELAFVGRYLDIQKIRFSDRLTFRIDATAEARRAMVPTLLLQPLVENAIRHGILARDRGGTVIVAADTRAGRLLLRVEDDGPGMQRGVGRNNGVGLSNTASRLSALFGQQSTFSVGRSVAGGVAVDIDVPLRFIPAPDTVATSEFVEA